MSLLLDWLFPRRCFNCGQTGHYLCPACQSQLPLSGVTPPSGHLDGSLAFFRYTGPLRIAITSLKYQFITDCVDSLSDLCYHQLLANYPHLFHYWLDSHFVFIPIPLYSRRQNWRGFNQSQLLAQSLSLKTSIPIVDNLVLRHHYTTSQVSLHHRRSRITNVAGSFSRNPDYLSPIPDRCILVDDVKTTGATLENVAAVLRAAGVTEIWSLTLAG